MSKDNENHSHAQLLEFRTETPRIPLKYSEGGYVPIDKLLEESSQIHNTPFINDQVYKNLPHPLNDLCSLFSNRERDIFLLSCLGFISGIVPKCYFLHDNKRYYPNLFLAIIAPPSSGKSHANRAKKLVSKIVEELSRKNKELESEYKLMLKNKEPVDKPYYQYLLMPGDSSNKAFKDLLHKNMNNSAIIAEDEIDTIVNVSRNEWGSWDDLFRKTFEHESISFNRAGDGYGTIDEPRLSVVMAGTPNQFYKLIPSAENGLYSRFGTYFFQSNPKWNEGVFQNNVKREAKYDQYFDKASEVIYDIWSFQQNAGFTKFIYNSQEINILNEFFSSWMHKNNEINAELVSDVSRGAVIFRRINFVLSILRHWKEHRSLPKTLSSSEEDFQSSLSIIETLLYHSITLYNSLPKGSRVRMRKNVDIFYSRLPDNKIFTTAEAVKIGEHVKISQRSVKAYLRNFVEIGTLDKVKQGEYIKNK